MNKISIIVTTYRRVKLLSLVLTSLEQQKGEFEAVDVWIIETGFNKKTELLCRAFNAPVGWQLMYDHQPRYGKIYAIEYALNKVKQDYVLLLDDDITFENDFVASYLAAIKRWPNAVAFGGPVESYSPGIIPNNAALEGRERLYLSWPHHDLGNKEVLYKQGQTPMGANRVLNKTLFKQGFIFDKKFISEGLLTAPEDDIGFGNRLIEAGLNVVYVPAAKVRHYVPAEEFLKNSIWKRYFDYGRYQMLVKKTNSRTFKENKYLLKELIVKLLDYGKSVIFIQKKKSLYLFAEIARLLGMLSELKKWY